MGLAGALLSFIAFFLLDNIVGKDQNQSAADICNSLHVNVRHTLKQDTANPDSRDGMDIAFCKIELEKKELIPGAHRPLLFLSEGELQYKGDKKQLVELLWGKK